MCILCVASRFSRRIITMLPWFFIPLIILWAFSQLLPPSLRFEITSPRLACIFVLLISIGWYEFILPRLSAWRARRSARMKEKKRVKEQLEAKWRREAVRKCRNCSTAYRDQNPVNGRFMCCYCGHISRRPVLDITGPDPAKMGLESMESYLRSSMSTYQGTYQGGKCPSRESYAGGVICILKKLEFPFFFVLWLWKKIWRRSSLSERRTFNSLCRTDLQKSEDRCNVHVNKVEKAKRKAEEKRQARLAKEMLEEEERKQREEVARLVEERSKLRIGRLEVDKASETEAAKQKEEAQREKEQDRKRQATEKVKAKVFCKNSHSADGGDLKNKNANKHEQKSKLEKCRETENKVPEYTAKHVREPVNFIKNSRAPHLTWEKGSKNNGQAKRGVTNGTAKIDSSRYSGSMKYSIVSSRNSPSYSSDVAWTCGKQFGMKSGKTDKPLYASSNGNGFSGSMDLNCGQSTYSVWDRTAWSNLWNKGTHIVHEDSCNKEKLLCNSKGWEDYEAMKHLYSCVERVYPSESPVGVELQTTSQVTTHTKSRHLTSSGISYSSGLGIKLEENPVETTQVILSSSPANIISLSSPKPTQLGLEPATPSYSNLVSVSGSAAQIISPSDLISQHFCASPVGPVTVGNASSENSLYEKDAVSLRRPLSDSLGNFSSEIGSTFPVDTRETRVVSSGCTPIPALSHRHVHSPSPVSRASSMEADGNLLVNEEQLTPITDLWNWPSLFSDCSDEISEKQNKQIWNKPKDNKFKFGKHSWSLPAQNMSDQEKLNTTMFSKTSGVID